MDGCDYLPSALVDSPGGFGGGGGARVKRRGAAAGEDDCSDTGGGGGGGGYSGGGAGGGGGGSFGASPFSAAAVSNTEPGYVVVTLLHPSQLVDTAAVALASGADTESAAFT